MYLEEKPLMKTIINHVCLWLNSRPRTKEWLWFVSLWVGGLVGIFLFTYPIKYLIKSMR